MRVTFFESLLALLLVAIVLLQISRRLAVPYPAMLAGAGVLVALIPGTPALPIDPRTALALFLAPALVDAAFDFPVGTAKRFWRPLVMFAVIGVLFSTAVVAWLGWYMAGLPVAAAVVLGAIVAPPDAAAASAVLSRMSVPRATDTVIKGESLFNDATALLLFGAALAVQSSGHLDLGVASRIALEIPGGVLLGIALAYVVKRINRFVTGTLGGNLLQFVLAFLVWIIADRLHLSAVLCVVAFAMTLARTDGEPSSPRMRVHSYAVWSAVVFVLNVFAFLVMGMQAKTIVSGLSPGALHAALRFAGAIALACIVARMVFVIAFNRWVAFRHARRGEPVPTTMRQAILVGWSGMRGLVTLAAAFALPANFPQRDLIVLSAFAVVLATLVLQGLTLGPLIRLLRLRSDDVFEMELVGARRQLGRAALARLAPEQGEAAERLRHDYRRRQEALDGERDEPSLERQRTLERAAIAEERKRLSELQRAHDIGPEAYLLLQEELDWRELTLLPDEERRIEES